MTKDEDFANMAILDGDAPTVVWVRVGNTRRAAFLAWLEPLIDEVISLVEAGNPLIELR